LCQEGWFLDECKFSCSFPLLGHDDDLLSVGAHFLPFFWVCFDLGGRDQVPALLASPFVVAWAFWVGTQDHEDFQVSGMGRKYKEGSSKDYQALNCLPHYVHV